MPTDERGTDVAAHPSTSRDRVVLRVVGDSGDGMQLTGDRFPAEAVASTAAIGPEDVMLHDPADLEQSVDGDGDLLGLLHGTDTRTVRDGAVLPHPTTSGGTTR